MRRWRVIAAIRARSGYKYALRGFSNSSSISSLRKIQSEVKYTRSPSQIFASIGLFQQNPVRFFSSDSINPIKDVEVAINHNIVFDDGTESTNLNFKEFLKNGVDEEKSTLEMEIFDSKNSEPVGNEVTSTLEMNGFDSGNRESVDVVNDNAGEFHVEQQLESVLSLLQGDVGESLESSLDAMNLSLSEEFVVRVLETPLVPGKNLIVFFRWALTCKNQEEFSVTTRSLDALVRAVCREFRKSVAYKLWDLVKELGEKETRVVTTEILNELISLFSRLGKGMAGYEVFNKFSDFMCVPNADSHYYTIEALCRRSIFDRVGSVCEEMVIEEKLPEAEKVGTIINYLCKGGMVKEAYSIYLSAKEKGRHPPQTSVNLLISSLCDRKKRDAGSVHLALKMLEDFSGEEKRKHAIKQFSCVVQGLCKVDDLEGAKALLFKMIEAGPPPGNAVFNTIINGLSKAGEMAEAIKIMRMMEGRGLKPDVFTYSVIMSGYAKGGEMEEAAKLLVEAKKNHSRLEPVTYHTLIRGYCKLEQFGKAVELLNEMEDYGVRPTADEYNKLIQSLCLKAADWGIATKLMEEMEGKGLHLNEMTKSLVRAVKELEEESAEVNEVSIEA